MHKVIQQGAATFGSLLVSVSAVAAEGESASSAPDPMAVSNLWQLTFGLLVVLGVMLGLAWLVKRSGKFQVAAGGGLKIIGGLSMGARERVVLLQVGETQLLVGVAPGQVQALHVLEQPLETRGQPVAGKFAEQLGRMMGKGAAQ